MSGSPCIEKADPFRGRISEKLGSGIEEEEAGVGKIGWCFL